MVQGILSHRVAFSERSRAIVIRRATPADHDAIWEILEPLLRAGETYALPRDWSRGEALAYWTGAGHDVFVASQGEAVQGTCYLRANHQGGGGHVANCGYVTARSATGRGVASAMCADSLARAKDLGFRAMQFNFVVATNRRAVQLWQRFGFETAGVPPGAFEHPQDGTVDALVMWRAL